MWGDETTGETFGIGEGLLLKWIMREVVYGLNKWSEGIQWQTSVNIWWTYRLCKYAKGFLGWCNYQLFKRIQYCRDQLISHWLSLRVFSTAISVCHWSFGGDIKVYAIHSITFSESVPSDLSSYSVAHPPLPATGPSELHVVIFQKKGGETTQKVRHCPL